MLNLVWMGPQMEMTMRQFKAEAGLGTHKLLGTHRTTVSTHTELGMWLWEQVKILKELEADVLGVARVRAGPILSREQDGR